MRVVRGVNPIFADYDEIDQDALEALDEFDNGLITMDELRHLVGPEAVRARAEIRYEGLLDDPENL